MKRFLLVLMAMIFVWTARGQEYEMNVSVNIRTTLNNLRCDSHFKLVFKMEDNTTWTWYEHLNMSEDDWKEFNKSFSFSADNPVVSIQCISHRYTRSDLGGCTHRGGGEKVYNVNTNDIPCSEQVTYNLFEGYDERSSLSIQIKPLSNVIAIQTEAFIRSNKNMDILGYVVNVRYHNGQTEMIASGHQENVGNTMILNWRELLIKPNRNLRITQIEVETSYMQSIFNIVNETQTYNVTDNGVLFDRTFDDSDPPFFNLGSGSYLRIKYGNVLTPLIEDGSGYLPSENSITLSIPESNGSYQWQYDNGSGFRGMPSRFGTNNVITLSGEELFTALFEDFKDHVPEAIRFKARYLSCDLTRESEIISLTHIASAPAITTTSHVLETCAGDGDSQLQINFARPLYNQEMLTVFLNSEVLDINASALDENNSLTLQNLSPNTYDISLQSFFNGIPGYTDGTSHFATEVIPARSPISNFSAIPSAVHCYDGQDGSIQVSATGGTQNYTAYLELNNQPLQQVSFAQVNSGTFSNLSSNTYSIRLKDSNNCDPKDNSNQVIVLTQNIAQPLTPTQISLDDMEEPLGYGLTDGYISMRTQDGTFPYTFQWSDEQNNALTPDPSQTQGSSMVSTMSGIGTGTYIIRTQDGNYNLASPATEVNRRGCYDTLTVFLTQPPLLEVALQEQHYVSCFGYNDGELLAQATGGKPFNTPNSLPYVFEWFVVQNNTPVPFDETTELAENRQAAIYRVRITDRNGITAWSPDFTLTQPDKLVLDFITSQLLCNGDHNGTSLVTPQGGTSPYQYSWSTEEITPQIQNLNEGMYSVVVTDFRNCTTMGQTEVIVPNGLEVSATITDPSCYGYNDGTIALSLAGGKQPYKAFWNSGSFSTSISNLSKGSYHVTITDDNDCFMERDYELEDPDLVPVVMGGNRVLCSEQSLLINAAIPDADAQYEWFKDGQLFSASGETEIFNAGIYKLRVTDGNGCSNENSITITRSENDIESEFVVATRVPKGEPVHITNISFPQPSRMEWIIPENVQVIKNHPDYLDLIFPEYGEYTIGLTSYMGACEETTFKTLRAVSKDELVDYEPPVEPFIKQFMVVPNPNKGKFKVIVELRENTDFELILYNSQGNEMVHKDVYRKSSTEIEMDVSATAGKGLYMLQLITAEVKGIFKVVIE